MPKIKLSKESVAGIRYARDSEKLSLGVLAKLYQVSRTQVWRIVNRKQWVPLSLPPTDSSLRSESGGDKRLHAVLTEEEVVAYLKKIKAL